MDYYDDDDDGLLSQNPNIIIDNGSGTIKAGLEIEKLPSVIFPSVVGRPRKRYEQYYEGKSIFVGNEVTEHISHLSTTYPIDHGHIDDWFEVEELWRHAFTLLSCDPENHPTLMTEPPICSSRHREKIAEIMFEVFSCPQLNISVTGLMAIYATGGLTGCILDIGEGITQCVPVIDGFVDRRSIVRSDFGGQEMTLLLAQTLCDMGYPLTTREEKEYVKAIKEMHCFCSLDPSNDATRNDLDIVYTLPDGATLRDGSSNAICLGPERIYPSEALFDPRLCFRDNLPLPEIIWQSLMGCPIDNRKTLLGKIFLCGGSTLYPNFEERLTRELKNTVPSEARNTVFIKSLKHREYLVWLGSKIFTKVSTSDNSNNVWISKEEYIETGEKIVHLKASLK